MQPYVQLNSHCIGKSHLAKSKPCEDYSLSYGDSSLSAAVISDGHGDSNCFRSAEGARLACEICINLFRQFQGISSHITDIGSCDFESMVLSLEREIAVKWRKSVIADSVARPFTPQEMEQVLPELAEQYRNGQLAERAYGCTLVAAMVTRSYLLCIQIGDGKCVSAYPDGIFVEPVPKDENCVGNRSTSLCSREAEKLFRHYFSGILPAAVFVSSDGVEESFDASGLYRFFYSSAYWCREEGVHSSVNRLNDLLPKISEGGSGDDVSIASFVSLQAELTAPKQPLEQVYQRVSAVSSSLEQIYDLILSENDKLHDKQRLVEEAERELDSLKKLMEQKEKNYLAVCDECEAIKAGLFELNKKRESAARNFEKAEVYKASAEKYWFAEYRRLGMAGYEQEETEAAAVPAEEMPAKTVFADEDLPPEHDE